jgi:gluconate:H+ symporter, GntP family
VDHTALVLIVAAAGVAVAVLLVTWLRVPAFIALAAAAVLVGLGAGMPLAEIARAFQSGVGDTLGFIAMIVGIGTVIGKLLAESGGAMVVSRSLVATLGEQRIDWALMLSALLIGLAVFFQVGLVLLVPVLFTLSRDTGSPLLRLGIPMLAGLSVAHGLTPPHPGPLAAIERLGADTGRTLVYSVIVGVPVAIVAGPVFGRFVSRRVEVGAGAMAEQLTGGTAASRPPSLAATLGTILLPVALMLVTSPLIAMLAAAFLSFYTFGRACGLDRSTLLRFAEEAIPAVAGVLLVVGAGGGFGRVLDASGVDTAIADVMGPLQLSPLVLGWSIAVLLRIAVGSATVACVTAASIVAPMAAAMPHVSRELMVVAIGAGSLIASHVNDGGFWLVKEYFNMTVPQTVATWTAMETIIAIAGLAAVLLLALVAA